MRANHVTLARIFCTPLLGGLLLAGYIPLWFGFIVGTILAFTDFIDGYLARRNGITVFGQLLDPMADKVFFVCVVLPVVEIPTIGFPIWGVILILFREFFITALRTSYELRSLEIETSYLAKIKTWMQMQGIGIIVFIDLISLDVVLQVFKLGVIISLVVILIGVIQKKFWKGAIMMLASFVALVVLGHNNNPHTIVWGTVVALVLVSWISALDYLTDIPRIWRSESSISSMEIVRFLGALVLPLSAGLMLHTNPIMLMLLLSGEIAVGGLDNLLVYRNRAASAGLWSVRQLSASLLLFCAFFVQEHMLVSTTFVWSAFVVSSLGIGYEFWRGRSFYLDDKMRREKQKKRKKRKQQSHLESA